MGPSALKRRIKASRLDTKLEGLLAEPVHRAGAFDRSIV